MSRVEERLSELLHGAVPPAEPLTYEPVVRLARRRRMRTRVAAAGAAVLVATGAGLAVGLTGSSPDAGPDVITTEPTPAPIPTLARNEIRQGGLTYAMPAGWRHSTGVYCGDPPDRTVVGGGGADEYLGPIGCPMIPASVSPRSFVTLSSIWNRQYVTGWSGKPVTWHGEPAFLDTIASRGAAKLRLTFPRLNAAVTSAAPDEATARELLERIKVPAEDRLAVPGSATTVRIQRPGMDTAGSILRTVVSERAATARLLDDLRSLSPADTSLPGCDQGFGVSAVLMTVTGDDGALTSYVIAGKCGLVTAGGGASSVPTEALRQDIERLAPLDPDHYLGATPACTDDQLAVAYAGSLARVPNEASAVVNVRNTGAAPCVVIGYPEVTFSDGRDVRGIVQNGGPSITDTAGVVSIAPGSSAHFVVVKSACGGDGTSITRMEMRFRATSTTATVALPALGQSGLQDCGGLSYTFGVEQPGHLFRIGPFVPGEYKSR